MNFDRPGSIAGLQHTGEFKGWKRTLSTTFQAGMENVNVEDDDWTMSIVILTEIEHDELFKYTALGTDA